MEQTVGICDDNAAHAAILSQYIRNSDNTDMLRILESHDPQGFLEIVRQTQTRLVFLDIDMDGISGIELGQRIKAMDQDAVIVYVTGHEKYALDAFRVRAFHYLLKPLTQDKVSAVLSEAIAQLQKSEPIKEEKTLTFARRGETVSLRMRDIACFEKVGHKIRVHMQGKTEEYYGNFTELMERIGSEGFLKCHQGYIVNADRIRALRDRTLFLDGGLQAPVSRTYAESVQKALAKRLFAGKGNE